ncbi:MAG: helix-turn-helix transcriptional regulator [Kibdelosporangium sp.]
MTGRAVSSGHRVEIARGRAGISQRALAKKAGLSQATLHRIEQGARTAKMPELIALARALGCSLPEISEHSPVRDRVICFARAENLSKMSGLRGELVHFLELDAYLEEQGIARP